MTFLNSVTAQFRPSQPEGAAQPRLRSNIEHIPMTNNEKGAFTVQSEPEEEEEQHIVSGAARIEAVQSVWGKHGKKYIIAGLAMIMLCYEFSNSTTWTYESYATSAFNDLSLLATLNTAATILFAVVKPPIAKISDVIGRGETYFLVILIFTLGFILCAAASSINSYAAGFILQNIGQSGTNLMNDIIIADISTARWRGFAISFSFLPFLITPWISAYIIQSVVTGIGWRWGIGMFAILTPSAASFIIGTLLYFQRKAKKQGIVAKRRITIYDFCSEIDLGGSILLTGGFSMLLLPLTLASVATSAWKTPYLDALIALGAACLIPLPAYEKWVAKHPVVPIHYFKNLTIVMSLLLISTDSLGFSCSHTYLYTWAVIAHGYSAKDATFYIYANGVTQTLMGIATGAIMYKTRRYKSLTLFAVVIRLVGYGIMIRLRGANNSTAELVLVQLIQGIGSGIIQIVVVVAPQIVVPHAQLAQITALAICCSFLGSSIGSAIAGAIYTGTFKQQLRNELGASATTTLVDTVFNSISGVLPAWGSPERIAINLAYSNVLRFMTYASLASSIPSIVFAFFLPNLNLPDRHNTLSDSF